MERVVSGIRSTGNLHLGNYFGAIQNFVKMQDTDCCYFFVADYHSLTTHPTPENLSESTKQVLAEFLACGINTDKCTLYVQSDIPEIPELYLLLNMNAYLGELERCTTFKEKARKQPNNINAGLLTYPVLMAADILIHKATRVPVGKDQEQHLEMTRTFASRFNRLYKTGYFPEPKAYNFDRELIKIPGLDGSGKMGKTDGNAIFLVDEPDVIRKKIMKAVTDTGPVQGSGMSEPVKNLFTLLKTVSSVEIYNDFISIYNEGKIRYGDLKKQLAEDVIKLTTPVRERIKEFRADEQGLQRLMKEGAQKARESAMATINDVRQIIGFRKKY